MKDPALEAYVSAIEDHLRARRGVDHILSPRDFALARTWYEAGVPLATVLVGMDRAFEQKPNVSSLSFCRRRVEELAAAGPRPPSRPAPPRGEHRPLRGRVPPGRRCSSSSRRWSRPPAPPSSRR